MTFEDKSSLKSISKLCISQRLKRFFVLFQLDRLAPKANNTHTIVVRPMKFGYFNFTAAEVRYKDNEDSSLSVERVVFSSEPGQGVIIAQRDYERQFSGHMVSFQASHS
jgi:translocon-associated protein subunit beta